MYKIEYNIKPRGRYILIEGGFESRAIARETIRFYALLSMYRNCNRFRIIKEGK